MRQDPGCQDRALADYERPRRKARKALEHVERERRSQLEPSRAFVPEEWVPLPLRSPIVLYKVAAAVGGRFVSVFDGSVAYQLDKWVHARHAGGCGGAAWPPLWSCMFCFETEEQALAARFPEGSKHLRGALVLLRVRAKGHAFAASGGRWAVESVMAERVLAYTPRAPGELFLDYSGGAFAGGGRL